LAQYYAAVATHQALVNFHGKKTQKLYIGFMRSGIILPRAFQNV